MEKKIMEKALEITNSVKGMKCEDALSAIRIAKHAIEEQEQTSITDFKHSLTVGEFALRQDSDKSIEETDPNKALLRSALEFVYRSH